MLNLLPRREMLAGFFASHARLIWLALSSYSVERGIHLLTAKYLWADLCIFKIYIHRIQMYC